VRLALLAAALLAAVPARADWPAAFAGGVAAAETALSAGDRTAAKAAVAALSVPRAGRWSAADRASMFLRRGELRAATDDYAGAEADYRAALKARPRDFSTLCVLTQFLRDRHRYDDALRTADVLTTVTAGIAPKNRAEKWLQRAETLMKMGRTEPALADIARALEAKPGDVPTWWLKTQILLRAGRSRAALKAADGMVDAAAAGAEKARALSQRAQVKERLGDAAGADADVAKALAEAPGDQVALEARVQRLRAEGRLGEALALADRMVAAGAGEPAPRRALLLEQRAQVKKARGDVRGAEADLRRALDAQADAPAPLGDLAELLADEGRGAEALAVARRLAASSRERLPADRARALEVLARAEDAAGLAAEAERDRAAARALAPESAGSLARRARAAREAGRTAEALRLSDALVAATKGAPGAERSDAFVERALAREAAGRKAGAERDLEEAARLSPEALFPRRELVLLALSDGRDDLAERRARDFFAAAGSTSARARAEALVLRAKVRAAKGRGGAAEDDLAAALQTDPGSREALAAMAETLTRQGRPERALVYADRLVAVSSRAAPGDLAAALAARATAREAAGRPLDALADLDLARARAPRSRETLVMRARLLDGLGRTAQALAAADELVAVSSGGAPSDAAGALAWRAGRRAAAGDWAGAASDHEAAEAALPGWHARRAEDGVGWAAAVARARGLPAAWALLARLRTAPGAPASARAALAAAEAESRWTAGDADGARAAMSAALSADADAACRETALLEDRAKAALAYFDACVARFPRDPALLNDRGVARWSAGRAADGEADFRAALAARPGFLPAALSLASALEARGAAREGAEVLARALKAAPKDPLADEARSMEARLSRSSAPTRRR
jgi:predicted Zn-dependent protease